MTAAFGGRTCHTVWARRCAGVVTEWSIHKFSSEAKSKYCKRIKKKKKKYCKRSGRKRAYWAGGTRGNLYPGMRIALTPGERDAAGPHC